MLARRASYDRKTLARQVIPLAPGYRTALSSRPVYLPTQIRFLIGGERVTCHWSKLNDALGRTKLNDALGKHYLELWTCTWSGRASWNRGKFVCQPRQANNFYAVMAAKRFQTLYFELGGITKHLMTGPRETVSFVSPRASMFPSASPRGTLRSRGNKTHCFPWDQSLSA